MCVELERRSLTYSRNLEKYREHGMAWMEKVMSRLPRRLNDTQKSHLTVLTFISSIALIMNGEYVDYEQLRDLLYDMGPIISQGNLQRFQILSKFTLPVAAKPQEERPEPEEKRRGCAGG